MNLTVMIVRGLYLNLNENYNNVITHSHTAHAHWLTNSAARG